MSLSKRLNASALYKTIILLLVLIILGLVAVPRPKKDLPASGITQNPTLRTIHSRKSVRHYLNKAVTAQQLETLLKAGMAAPTAGDSRPWSFIAITDKRKLSLLAQGLSYAEMLRDAGAAIVVCGLPEKSYPGVLQGYWVQDCSAATQNILLAAESLGLGAVWIGIYPNPNYVPFIQKTLGLPANVIPLNVISIGYPSGIEKPRNKFNPQNIHWEKW